MFAAQRYSRLCPGGITYYIFGLLLLSLLVIFLPSILLNPNFVSRFLAYFAYSFTRSANTAWTAQGAAISTFNH